MTLYDNIRPTGQPSWFDVMVPDVKKAAEFYHAIFGWDYIANGEDYGFYHMAMLQERTVAGIGQAPEGSNIPAVWTVYYAAVDVDALSQKVIDLGGAVINEPMDVPEQGRMAIVQDPTGAVFGLWQAINHIGAGITDVHGAMAWCEVNTPDAEASLAFYNALFGTTADKLELASSPYYLLKQGETTVGGILQMNEEWQGVPPHWMAYFHVDDVAATCKKVLATGGKVCIEPFMLEDGRHIAVIDDPFGATFSITQPAT